MTFEEFFDEYYREVKRIIQDIIKLINMVETTNSIDSIKKIYVKDYLMSAISKLGETIGELETYKILRGEGDL